MSPPIRSPVSSRIEIDCDGDLSGAVENAPSNTDGSVPVAHHGLKAESQIDEMEMTVMHWMGKRFVTLIGACYAGAMERAIAPLPYDALDAA